MLPHALPSATWELQGRGVDQHGKEWFRGKDMCMILGFQDAKDALAKKVKLAYRSSQAGGCGTLSPHISQ